MSAEGSAGGGDGLGRFADAQAQGAHGGGAAGEAGRALDAAFAFLERRDRTESEIRERLRKTGFAEEAQDSAIDTLKGLGYVDDARFAKRFLESSAAKGRGALRIRAELRQRGVTQADASDALEQCYAEEDELGNAMAVAARTVAGLPQGLMEGDPQKAYAKISRKLAGRGFSYNIIGQVMERVRRGDLADV